MIIIHPYDIDMIFGFKNQIQASKEIVFIKKIFSCIVNIRSWTTTDFYVWDTFKST